MNKLFARMDIAASGLSAHQQWMDLIAGNIANANTTLKPDQQPFRQQEPVFRALLDEEGRVAGVVVDRIIENDSEVKKVQMPGHPDADAEGYVSMTNIDVMREMVNLIAASRGYEANATVMEAAKSSIQRSISLLQV